jgi:ribosomal protein S18 acetylase RimI-like enzyme
MERIAWRIEAACRAAWPATRARDVQGWRVGLTGHGARRLNAAMPLHDGAMLDEAIIARIEAVFAAAGLPALFRVPSIAAGADEALDRAGYAPGESRTRTLSRVLAAGDAAPPRAIQDMAACAAAVAKQELPAGEASRACDVARRRGRVDGVIGVPDDSDAVHACGSIAARPDAFDPVLEPVATAAWVAIRSAIVTASEGRAPDIAGPLALLPPATCFARIDDRAVGFVAISDGIAVLEAIATTPDARGRGLARAIVAALLDWARAAGAQRAALQVMADNAPALALYRRLGFGPSLYDYHYRRRAA